MSNITRSIYAANPAIFDATQEVVSIGDLVVDPAGINDAGIVRGPNTARTVSLLGSLPGADIVTVVPSAPAAATLRLTITFTTATGAPRSFATVVGAIGSGAAGLLASFFSGKGVFSENSVTPGELTFVGATTGAGVVAIDLVGTPADTVDGLITDVTTSPVTGLLIAVIPP
jgi:hypothetical protein